MKTRDNRERILGGILLVVIIFMMGCLIQNKEATSIELKEVTNDPNDLIPITEFDSFDTPYELVPDIPIFADIIDLAEAGEYSKSLKLKWYYDSLSKKGGVILVIDKLSYKNPEKVKAFIKKYGVDLLMRKLPEFVSQQYVSEQWAVYEDATETYLVIIAAASPEMFAELNKGFLEQKTIQSFYVSFL